MGGLTARAGPLGHCYSTAGEVETCAVQCWAVLCLPQHNLRGVLLADWCAAGAVGPLFSCQLSRQLHERKWWNTALVVFRFTKKVGSQIVGIKSLIEK